MRSVRSQYVQNQRAKGLDDLALACLQDIVGEECSALVEA